MSPNSPMIKISETRHAVARIPALRSPQRHRTQQQAERPCRDRRGPQYPSFSWHSESCLGSISAASSDSIFNISAGCGLPLNGSHSLPATWHTSSGACTREGPVTWELATTTRRQSPLRGQPSGLIFTARMRIFGSVGFIAECLVHAGTVGTLGNECEAHFRRSFASI